MPVDASIYGQFLQRPKSVMDYEADYDQAQTRKNALQLAAMDLSEKTQANQRAAQVRNALMGLGGAATDEQRIATLRATATPEGFSQADALEKTLLERQKTAAQVGKDKAQTGHYGAQTDAENFKLRIAKSDQAIKDISGFQTPQQALASLEQHAAAGDIPPEQAQVIRQSLASMNPADFPKWQLGMVQNILTAKERMQYLTPDANAKLQADTSTANNTATNATSRENNRETNATHIQTAGMTTATTRRGQDMVDERTRETTAAAMSKPFEITGEDGKPVLVQQDKQGNIKPVAGYTPKQGASKPLTDTQAKALQFGSRMQAAEDVIGALAGKGVTTSIPGSRGGYGVGTAINALQPADRQRLDQAKRDFINAVLRRESGAAISPSEFDSAEKQYFPQPGETDPNVLAQKKSNRDLATRGILAEVPDSDARVAKVRGGQPAAPAAGLPDANAIDAELARRKGKK